jgi:hypothetical protein
MAGIKFSSTQAWVGILRLHPRIIRNRGYTWMSVRMHPRALINSAVSFVRLVLRLRADIVFVMAIFSSDRHSANR